VNLVVERGSHSHLFVAAGWTMTTDRRRNMTYLDGRSRRTHHAKGSKGNITVGRTASGECKSLGGRGEAHHGEGRVVTTTKEYLWEL
jgi:hypothetical protein